MSSEFYRRTIRNYRKVPSLSNWLQYYSVEVWNRIGFTRKLSGGKISETTITENLIYEFWKLASGSNFPIEIYEAKNERTNGNDLEIFIETDKGYLLIPVQAKILYSNDQYMAMPHQVRGQDQIQLLIDYANRKGGIPFYLLYNYTNDVAHYLPSHLSPYTDISIYGCSMIGADYIYKYWRNGKLDASGKYVWMIPKFQNIHPRPAFPLHELIYSLQKFRLKDWLAAKKTNIGTPKLKFYNRQELASNNNWKDLAPLPQIGFVINGDKQRQVFEEINNLELNVEFNPKFRIIIPRKKRKNWIIRYFG